MLTQHSTEREIREAIAKLEKLAETGEMTPYLATELLHARALLGLIKSASPSERP